MNEKIKTQFEKNFRKFIPSIEKKISDSDGLWTMRGIINNTEEVYPIANDTKIISKFLENQIFPLMRKFAEDNGFKLVLPPHQNYYPDASFVNIDDPSIRIAVDLKTTYRSYTNSLLCNGFTLGSHGKYFHDRTSSKNITYPYGSYLGHYSLCLIYDRSQIEVDETIVYTIQTMDEIPSIVSNFDVFLAEKWKIASDTPGSGNTANIGSIKNIADLRAEKGVFSKLGEKYFDDYWMAIDSTVIINEAEKKLRNITDYVTSVGGKLSDIVAKNNKKVKV